MKSFWKPIKVTYVAAGVLALAGFASPASAKVHRCSPHMYWTNIRVDRLSCGQANRLHREKLRNCSGATRRVKRNSYVWTCYFGRWTSTEWTNRYGAFFDRIFIRRDHGRIWLRYDALP